MVYCENPSCRVGLYQTGDMEADQAKDLKDRDPVGVMNCPGCGRFGRTKG